MKPTVREINFDSLTPSSKQLKLAKKYMVALQNFSGTGLWQADFDNY